MHPKDIPIKAWVTLVQYSIESQLMKFLQLFAESSSKSKFSSAYEKYHCLSAIVLKNQTHEIFKKTNRWYNVDVITVLNVPKKSVLKQSHYLEASIFV